MRHRLSALLVVAAALTTTAAPAAPPRGVSPGSAEAFLAAPGGCPTFSWTMSLEARRLELLVQQTEEGRDRAVLRTTLPAGATTWTPPADRCLATGSYAWVVRSLGEERAPWSAPLFFTVPPPATALNLERAVELLRELATRDPVARQRLLEALTDPDAVASDRDPVLTRKSLLAAATAIHGEVADSSGETYGVRGVVASADGSGVRADNTAGGPDLVLGAAEPAQLTESALVRVSGTDVAFDFANPGTGTMTLRVDGVSVDTALTPIDWSRLTSVPAGFADGTDDNTTYSAGNQLALAGTSFAVLEGADSGLDADTLDGFQGTAYQRRVSGTCADDEMLRGIAEDGTAICDAAGAPPVFVFVTGGAGTGNAWSSLAIGTDGHPVIAFGDVVHQQLSVAKCHDPLCIDRTVSAADTTALGGLGAWCSLAIGRDGFPVVGHYDTMGPVRVTKCNDPACSGGDEISTEVDPGALTYPGAGASVAIGADGLPVMSYQGAASWDLRVLKCDDPACTGGGDTVSVVDDSADDATGYHSSLAIGRDGLPVMSYSDSTGALRLARCNDPACAGGDESLSTIGGPAFYTSLAIGVDGLPIVAYYDPSGSVGAVKCDNPSCTARTTTMIDGPSPSVGAYLSLAIGNDGLPVISYEDETAHALRIARCADPGCVQSAVVTLDDSANEVGWYTSIAVGADGRPVVSYIDYTANVLKLAKCSNAGCRP